MNLKLNHEIATKVAAKILEEKGYDVLLDKDIGNDFSIDLFAVNSRSAIIMEFKPSMRIDSFDIVALESYAAALESKLGKTSKKIQKLMIGESLTEHAEELSRKYGIKLISTRSHSKFTRDLQRILE